MGLKSDICEIKFDGDWIRLNIEEVLEMTMRPLLRCVECHGVVRPHKEANNGMRAHFEDRKSVV